MIKIRDAEISDIKDITAIYNWAILNTVATFDNEIKSIDEQKSWFNSHGNKNPIMVAELDENIVGWTSLTKWSDRCAYSDTAELSLYVKEGFMNIGIGRKLMKKIIDKGNSIGLHVLIARITEGNENSIHLHESFGFSHIGIMRQVGRKFGKLLDVYLLQKIY
jgi:phosphinothricin acetyltransferase